MFVNPDFKDFTIEQKAALVQQMESLVRSMFEYDDLHMMGDGNLEMMVESFLYDALKAMTERGVLITDDGHVYELRNQ